MEEVGNKSRALLFLDLLHQAGWLEEEVATCVSPCLGLLYLPKLLVVLHTDWLCTETAGKMCRVSLRCFIFSSMLSLETPEDAE